MSALTTTDILSVITDLIGELTGVRPTDVKLTTRLDAISAYIFTSSHIEECIYRLFGIELTRTALANAQTIGDFVDNYTLREPVLA